ncbi:translocation/assembly module TamB domain-containing protein [Persephonella sp.]
MKNVYLKILASFFIGIIFLSLIIFSGYFLITNYKTFLKKAGIYVEEDCVFRDGNIFCEEVSVTDRKVFNFTVKNLRFSFFPENLLKKDTFIQIDIDDITGTITPKEEKKDKKQNSDFNIYIIELLSTYVDLTIKNGNVIVKNKDEISINQINFYKIRDKFYIKRPVNLKLKDNSFSLNELYGRIKIDDRIYLDRLLIINNKNFVEFSGFIQFNGNFFLRGEGHLPVLTLEGLNLKDLHSEINMSKIGSDITGVLDYKIKNISYKGSTFENINGELKIIKADFLRLINSVNIDKFSHSDLNIFNIKSSSDTNFINGAVNSSVVVNLEKSKIKRYEIPQISTEFSLTKKGEDLKLSGDFYLDRNYGDFDIFLSKDKKNININLNNVFIDSIFKILSINDIRGYGSGKINADLIKNKLVSTIKFKDLNIFGINYNEGKLDLTTDLKDIISRLNLTLDKTDGYLTVNGILTKEDLNLDLDFKNLNFGSVKFLEKIDLKGYGTGSGKVEGKYTDISVSIQSIVDKLSYRSLTIPKIKGKLFFKNMTLSIDAETLDKKIFGDLSIHFKPFKFKMFLFSKGADLRFTDRFLTETVPVLFSRIKLHKGTGTVNIDIESNNWNVKFDIPDITVYLPDAGDTVNTKILGNISKEKKNISAYVFKKSFNFKGSNIEDITGSFNLSNSDGLFQLKVTGLENFDSFNLFLNGTFNLSEKTVNGDIFSSLTKDKIKSIQNLNFVGNFSKISGVLFNEAYINEEKISENFLNYTFNLSPVPKLNINSKKIKFFVNSKLEVFIKNLNGEIYLPQKNSNLNGFLMSDQIEIQKNKVTLTKTDPFKINITEKSIFTKSLTFKGILSGVFDIINYNIPERKLYVVSEGSIGKQIISEIIQLGSASGSINFFFKYDGNLIDPIEKIYLSLDSKNLRLKTPYTRDVIDFNKVEIELKEGVLTVDVQGSTPSNLFGESFVSFKGKSVIKTFKNLFDININMLPVKYSSIFVGNINSDINIKSKKEKNVLTQSIKGKIHLGGRVRIDQSVIENFQKKEKKKILTAKEKAEQEQILKKTFLDLTASTYSPVYLYGNWGNAYGEGRITITGALTEPEVNGEFNIIYGRINYMKNKYNIDYANINIIDNEPYINARLSTSVADTFIFINIYGSVKKPRLDFSSSPPKSKDEILSILLLKDTPSALENIPVFKTLGRIIYALIPFKSSEEEGLFNTGFEVFLNPQYSPTQGITASIYAKRPITRRIYLALSKPLSETQEFQASGWYELGLKLTERTSIQIRSFETGESEFDINFSLPFDF